jgi:hypothetical protein
MRRELFTGKAVAEALNESADGLTPIVPVQHIHYRISNGELALRLPAFARCVSKALWSERLGDAATY